jgi:predicted phage baseplate assembly protein
VSLPQIQLDDRRFQDLVDEARRRIARSCPEWTEHNVSDPGVTLIELFAWMTEMITYRLNRVPDKVHVALLELLGIRLEAPTAASAEVFFRLAGPAKEDVLIPRQSEVGTMRTESEESIVFQTADEFTIPALRPERYVVERGGKAKEIGIADGWARPAGADRLPFATPPVLGDGLYLGFEAPLSRLVVQVEVEASQARGVGVDPTDPPLRWEVSGKSGEWIEARVLSDGTGGFNFGSGTVDLELPAESGLAPVAGHRMHWLRCRVADSGLEGRSVGASYSHPPEISALSAAPIGAMLRSSHSSRVAGEVIGESDGTPAQSFQLSHTPVLEPAVEETLEVREPGAEEWIAWELRDSFISSHGDDRHFVLDLASGELQLGPAVRQPDGRWAQRGAVPPKDSVLRFTTYRHGGGRRGNVAPGALAMLKSSIPGVATVTNPRPALGGVDAEALDSARRRAAMEIRTRYRAVTAGDYEYLASEASRRVARAKCLPPANGDAIRLHLLSQVEPPDRRLSLEELMPDPRLLEAVGAYLDERRPVGTTLELVPVPLRGVSVVVDIQAEPLADPQRIERDVTYALYSYVNPLIGGSTTGPGGGWPFGRTLNQGELFGIVYSVPGVHYVRILRMYETDLVTGEQAAQPAGSHLDIEPHELIASAAHTVRVTRRDE